MTTRQGVGFGVLGAFILLCVLAVWSFIASDKAIANFSGYSSETTETARLVVDAAVSDGVLDRSEFSGERVYATVRRGYYAATFERKKRLAQALVVMYGAHPNHTGVVFRDAYTNERVGKWYAGDLDTK